MTEGSGEAAYRVRSATAEDAEAVVAFNRAMARETERKELDPEVLRAGVRSLLAEAARGRYFLAETVTETAETAGETASEAGGSARPAGQAAVTYEWSDWRNGPIWWIQSVYVVPEHRRRGVYALLHRHIRRAAREAGAIGLRLYVERRNAAAHAAYRSLGMERAPYVMFQDLWGVPGGRREAGPG